MNERFRVGIQYEGREDRIWWVGSYEISIGTKDAIAFDKEETDTEIEFRRECHMGKVIFERVT